jgi:hypothetical protein
MCPVSNPGAEDVVSTWYGINCSKGDQDGFFKVTGSVFRTLDSLFDFSG